MSEDREMILREMLWQLQCEYAERAKPIIDELVEIEARKPPKPVLITMAERGMIK